VFKSRVPGKIFGFQKQRVTRELKKLNNESLIIYTPHQDIIRAIKSK
jgi:hypothetical protein